MSEEPKFGISPLQGFINKYLHQDEVKAAIESIPQWRCDKQLHNPEGCPKCIVFKELGLDG